MRHDCPCDNAYHLGEVTPLSGSRLLLRYRCMGVVTIERGRCMIEVKHVLAGAIATNQPLSSTADLPSSCSATGQEKIGN